MGQKLAVIAIIVTIILFIVKVNELVTRMHSFEQFIASYEPAARANYSCPN